MQYLLQFQTPLEWLVTLLALCYVFLAAKNWPIAWVFGGLACMGWAYLDVVKYRLYSDALLQIFYVIMAIVGLYRWRAAADKELRISKMQAKDHFWMLVLSVSTGLLLAIFVGAYFPAAATYWDAITTSASVGATFLLLNRKLENWLYWVVIDLTYIGIYASRGAWFFAALMLVYVLVAIGGYFNWRKILATT